jgi:tRNA modification GTPase
MREIARHLERVVTHVAALHDSFKRGKIAHDGLRAVIAGKPNAGKSSLLNLLLGSERAIVTPIPGTTRDVIEDTVHVGPYALVIADTAGLREASDQVESIGIERARKAAANADLILAVFDISRPFDADDAQVIEICRDRPALAILNKSDLPGFLDRSQLNAEGLTAPVVALSALTGGGLGALRDALAGTVEEIAGSPAGAEIAISRERHRVALARAIDSLQRARTSALGAMPPEIVAVDVMAAGDALGRITGEVTSEEVLDAVFREFCIGK